MYSVEETLKESGVIFTCWFSPEGCSMSTYPELSPSESSLEGRWISSGSTVVADYTTNRIEHLVNNVLVQVANDDTGWMTLYRDPADGRYWELSYPDSSSHGGGAPLLKLLSQKEAKNVYRMI